MIPAIFQTVSLGWSLAQIAAPGTTQRLVDSVTKARSTPVENQTLANQLNAMANMAAAYNQMKSRIDASNDPAVIQANVRLGEAMRSQQDAREAMVRDKLAGR